MTSVKPKNVRVGPHNYKILYDTDRCNDTESSYGFTRASSTEIVIDPENSESRQRETMLHEILHALLEVSGAVEKLEIITEENEEKVVSLLSPLLLDLLKRNPKVTTYLLGE